MHRLGEFGGTPRRGQKRTSPSALLQCKQRFQSRSLCAESIASSFLAASADIGENFSIGRESRGENCAESFSGRWEVCPEGACQLWGTFPELSLLYFSDAPDLCSQHIRIYLPLICLRVHIYSTIPIFIFILFPIYFFIYMHVYNCLTQRNASEMPHLSYQHCLNSPFISPVKRRWEEQTEESEKTRAAFHFY